MPFGLLAAKWFINYMAVLCTKLDIYDFALSTWHIEHVDEFPNSFTFMFYRRFFFYLYYEEFWNKVWFLCSMETTGRGIYLLCGNNNYTTRHKDET